MIIGLSGNGKTNAPLNLIQQDNNVTGKIYLYAKDLEEPKYQFLIKKREQAGIKNLNDPTAFIEYFNSMDNVYDAINDYNPNRKRKVLIVYDDIIADIMTNRKFQAIIKELFCYMKEIVYLVFISQSHFSVPKEIRLNSTHYLIMKIHNKRELQNIAINIQPILTTKIF